MVFFLLCYTFVLLFTPLRILFGLPFSSVFHNIFYNFFYFLYNFSIAYLCFVLLLLMPLLLLHIVALCCINLLTFATTFFFRLFDFLPLYAFSYFSPSFTHNSAATNADSRRNSTVVQQKIKRRFTYLFHSSHCRGELVKALSAL